MLLRLWVVAVVLFVVLTQESGARKSRVAKREKQSATVTQPSNTSAPTNPPQLNNRRNAIFFSEEQSLISLPEDTGIDNSSLGNRKKVLTPATNPRFASVPTIPKSRNRRKAKHFSKEQTITTLPQDTGNNNSNRAKRKKDSETVTQPINTSAPTIPPQLQKQKNASLFSEGQSLISLPQDTGIGNSSLAKRKNGSTLVTNPRFASVPTLPKSRDRRRKAKNFSEEQSFTTLPQETGISNSIRDKQFKPKTSVYNNIPPRRLTVPKHSIMVPYVDDTYLQYMSTVIFQNDDNNLMERIKIIYNSDTANGISSIKIDDESKLSKLLTYKALDDVFSTHKDKAHRRWDIVRRLTEKSENNFLQQIMKTTVMKTFFSFIKTTNIGLETALKQKEFLKNIWFTKFNRQRRETDGNSNQPTGNRRPTVAHKSSGFQHVFLGEKPTTSLSGMHNWYFVYKSLKNGDMQLNEEHSSRPFTDEVTNKALVQLKSWIFTYAGMTKQSTMMLGISPELEIALATLCFIFRTNEPCILALGDHSINLRVVTKDIKQSGHPENLVISTYYPNFSKSFKKKEVHKAPLQGYNQSRNYGSFPGKMNTYPYPFNANGNVRIPLRVWG